MPVSIALVIAAAFGGMALLVAARRRVRGATRAVLHAEGYQEAAITIDGRYRPDTVRVVQGVPVRLRFMRQEDAPCSERVVFSAFGVDRRLPAFQETAVEFMPATTGAFLFTCQQGVYRGKLLVQAAGERSILERLVGGNPLFMALLLWFCTLPVLFVVMPGFIGWKLTFYAAGIAFLGEAAVCWALFRQPPWSKQIDALTARRRQSP